MLIEELSCPAVYGVSIILKYQRFSAEEMEMAGSKCTDAVTQTLCLKCLQGAISLLAAVFFFL